MGDKQLSDEPIWVGLMIDVATEVDTPDYYRRQTSVRRLALQGVEWPPARAPWGTIRFLGLFSRPVGGLPFQMVALDSACHVSEDIAPRLGPGSISEEP